MQDAQNTRTKNLWPRDVHAAREIQDILRKRVKILPLRTTPAYVAAADAAFTDNEVIAVSSLSAFPSLECRQDTVWSEEIRFPYVPGLLTFREGHAIINALKRLRTPPDVILVDGQGIAHPRGIGIASHIGVILGKPTIGCAKSRLIGEFREPWTQKGSWSYLYYKGREVGAVLRTRDHVKPLFISPGHLIDIPSSLEIVMECLSGYRIPEPLRRADSLSREFSRHRRHIPETGHAKQCSLSKR
jgi:deoxyribonuclease V